LKSYVGQHDDNLEQIDMSETTHHAPVHLDHRILAGTDDGLREVGERTPLFDAAGVRSIATTSDGIWVLSGDGTVWRVGSGGTEQVARIADRKVRTLAADGDDVWIGGAEATLWRLSDGQLTRVGSFDTSPTHDEWYTPWGGPPDVFSIAAGHGEVYVNVHVGGILRSSDRGESWAPTIDLHDDVHHVAVDGSGTVWAATGRRGLARSTDRGASWDHFTDGLHSPYALAVAPTSDGAVVCASSGPGTRDGRLARLEGERLVPSTAGLPDDLGGTVGAGRLASVGDEVVMAAPDGAVYASTDGGAHWIRATPDIGAVAVALR
jgi:hypothetical protein